MAKIQISFILDETGSMQTYKQETMAGFNEYIKGLRESDEAKKMKFTLTKFNSNKVEMVYDSVKLNKVAELNDENYLPDASTPLYDAIGRTIRALETKGSDHCLVVIQTDGLENASKLPWRRPRHLEAIGEKISERYSSCCWAISTADKSTQEAIVCGSKRLSVRLIKSQ